MRIAIVVLLVLFAGVSFAQCDFIKITAGGYHSLACKTDSTCAAWGWNLQGQLGNHADSVACVCSKVPIKVKDASGWGTLSGVIDVVAGGEHSIALKSDGTVWTWGHNCCGQLGDGTIDPLHSPNYFPRQVKGPGGLGFLDDIVDVEGGGGLSMALKSDSTVWTWGANYFGTLGDGTYDSYRDYPGLVVDYDSVGYLTGIIAIAAGDSHAMALNADGNVFSWGEITGAGFHFFSTNIPVRTNGVDGIGYLSDIVAICAGWYHSVALKSDGTLYAWGLNHHGQLGDGTTDTHSDYPVQVVGIDGIGYLTDVIAISAGGNHTLALLSDSTLLAWGQNTRGQLGNGTTLSTNSPTHVINHEGVSILDDIISIECGSEHTLAMKSDGTLWTWGRNNHGQLGDGTNDDSSVPVRILCEDVEMDFSRGWNLVSVPTVEPQHSSIFGTSTFGYDPSTLEYFTTDSLHPGKGYFLLSMSPDTVELPRTLHSYSDTLHLGWNLIGAVNIPLPVSSIETDPPGLLIPPLFGWDGADYFPADTLYPGKGYWFLSSGNGRIEAGP